MDFSIITTCKDRLDHLEQTIGMMLNQSRFSGTYEVIVVDYGCPQNTFGFCAKLKQKHNYEHLNCIGVLNDTEIWNSSRARNIGSRLAKGDKLFFVDADISINRRALKLIDELFKKTGCDFARKDSVNGNKPNANGTFCIKQETFHKHSGYHEGAKGWARETTEFYRRLNAGGAKEFIWNEDEYITKVIRHGNDRRIKFSPFDTMQENRRQYFNMFVKESLNEGSYGNADVILLNSLLNR